MIIDSHAHAGVRSELDWDFASVAEHRAYDQRLLWTRLNIGRKLEVRRWEDDSVVEDGWETLWDPRHPNSWEGRRDVNLRIAVERPDEWHANHLPPTFVWDHHGEQCYARGAPGAFAPEGRPSGAPGAAHGPGRDRQGGTALSRSAQQVLRAPDAGVSAALHRPVPDRGVHRVHRPGAGSAAGRGGRPGADGDVPRAAAGLGGLRRLPHRQVRSLLARGGAVAVSAVPVRLLLPHLRPGAAAAADPAEEIPPPDHHPGPRPAAVVHQGRHPRGRPRTGDEP